MKKVVYEKVRWDLIYGRVDGKIVCTIIGNRHKPTAYDRKPYMIWTSQGSGCDFRDTSLRDLKKKIAEKMN